MNAENRKCVIIINEQLPTGIIANTAAILGISLGMKMPDIVGKDVFDSDGNLHTGIIQFPVPILKGNSETLKNIRKKLFENQSDELVAIDFTDLAQGCKDYNEFIYKMANSAETNLNYIGIAVCGNRKKINKLTGNLPLLR